MATANMEKGGSIFPNYQQDKEACREFLRKYTNIDGENTYEDMLKDIANRRINVFNIKLDDISSTANGEELVAKITNNVRRFTQFFSEVVDELATELVPNPSLDTADVADVLLMHRRQQQAQQQQAQQQQNGEAVPFAGAEFPKDLTRRYEIRFESLSKTSIRPIREIKAAQIGQLVQVVGIVTRISDVKPLVSIATYICDQCGHEIYQDVKGQTFMPLTTCPTARCRQNRNAGKLHLQTRGSKFHKFQDVRIQELAEHVPIGHVPRSMTVHLTGECTRTCSAGDHVTITGTFLPIPATGFRAMKSGLTADTFLEAMNVERHKKNYKEYAITADMEEQIVTARSSGDDMYTKLSKSIAPEIYGHDDVKKALLLLLVGGHTRIMSDGMKIRGDINVLLMGDPGVAKSQLLKHISTLAPRGVYTTGKGSSGVGLTAAVMRDPITNELTLEGGALVLADMGICCIDEFDKMDDSDRTSIHEVMEQQTVSIAKGGITTTLNARTAVLAAANPAYGRYNIKRNPAENINLPASLLSRFDMLFLLLDKPDMEKDMALARHVTHVHKNNRHPELSFEALSGDFMRNYVAIARRYEPVVPASIAEDIVSMYVELRSEDDEEAYTYTSARTLLSIIRLSQALARLRFSTQVMSADVEEACRLMQCSKTSLMEEKGRKDNKDPISAVYGIIRDYMVERKIQSVKYDHIQARVLAKGYRDDTLREVIEEYRSIGVLDLNAAGNRILWVDPM